MELLAFVPRIHPTHHNVQLSAGRQLHFAGEIEISVGLRQLQRLFDGDLSRPGRIDVAPAIAVTPTPHMTLTDVLPGGAYERPQPVAELAPSRSILLGAGVLLFVAGFLASASGRHPQVSEARIHDSGKRWEQTLARLDDDSKSDDEWSDLLRRCVTWYCVDELGRNPYAWLGETARDQCSSAEPALRARDFFLDVLDQERIDASRRAEYRDRLRNIIGRGQRA